MKISHTKLLVDLKFLGLDGIVIRHNPMTKRYLIQASASLQRLLDKGKVLGWRLIPSKYERSVELSLFVDAALDIEKDCGLYGCFRIHYDRGRPFEATFFCFYNGEDKSPCIKSRDEAKNWMKEWAKKNHTEYEGIE
jgi:hypothetical protein